MLNSGTGTGDGGGSGSVAKNDVGGRTRGTNVGTDATYPPIETWVFDDSQESVTVSREQGGTGRRRDLSCYRGLFWGARTVSKELEIL